MIRYIHGTLLLLVLTLLVWSAIHPHDWFTWFLEVSPALAGLIVLLATYRRFPFTTFTYLFLALHTSILFIGGHYTYALVPGFTGLFGWQRNNFDRLGHFAQGFVPALVARELFIRLQILRQPGWQPFLIVCVCLAISAAYELIEWGTASLSGDSATAFLGTQGDIWDTQKDMFTALVGAIVAVTCCARLQDWALRRLSPS